MSIASIVVWIQWNSTECTLHSLVHVKRISAWFARAMRLLMRMTANHLITGASDHASACITLTFLEYFALLVGSEFTAVCWQLADALFVPRPWPLPLLQALALMTAYAQSNNGCNSTFSWPHCMFLSQAFTHRGYWWFSQAALQGPGAFRGAFRGDSCPMSK